MRSDNIISDESEKLKKVEQLERLEELEDQDIRYLLNKTADNYHKPPVRTYVVEPFLVMLDFHMLWTRAQPFTDAVKALFDWLGIERKYRLTDTSIRVIVRELKRDYLPRFRGGWEREGQVRKIKKNGANIHLACEVHQTQVRQKSKNTKKNGQAHKGQRA